MLKIVFLAVLIASQIAVPTYAQSIDFGDNNGEWAHDGECDDKRFEGPGMTETILLEDDIMHDAADCSDAFEAKTIKLREVQATDLVVDDINFGKDSSEWANDNECDDPRFEGQGMTRTTLLAETIKKDASDCAKAYQAGTLFVR